MPPVMWNSNNNFLQIQSIGKITTNGSEYLNMDTDA